MARLKSFNTSSFNTWSHGGPLDELDLSSQSALQTPNLGLADQIVNPKYSLIQFNGWSILSGRLNTLGEDLFSPEALEKIV